ACDLRPADRVGAALSRLPDGVETVLGGYDRRVLDDCAAVYASPGVPWHSELLERARAASRLVSSEMDLFFQLCPAPIVGVTGTNGKTTTAGLAGSPRALGGPPGAVRARSR